jgi:hypothetical protein
MLDTFGLQIDHICFSFVLILRFVHTKDRVRQSDEHDMSSKEVLGKVH